MDFEYVRENKGTVYPRRADFEFCAEKWRTLREEINGLRGEYGL